MLDLYLQPRPDAIADPRLIVANTIIHYSSVELDQAIARELDENPALEMSERIVCPICARQHYGNSCSSCAARERVEHPTDDIIYKTLTGETGYDGGNLEEQDAFWSVAAPETLGEYLLGQLHLVLSPDEQEVALHIVDSLNEHGYLITSPEELAETLQVEVARVEYVLRELQELDPPGIGARSVQECLLLQLQRIEQQGQAIPYATRPIIQHHLEALGHHRFEQIRQALALSRDEVEDAFIFIRTNLHPYPANHYYGQDGDTLSHSPHVRPSILIQRRTTPPHSYEVEVVEAQRLLVRMNPLYQRLRQQPDPGTPASEREHVQHFFERARIFLGALQRRHHVLQELASYLVTAQRDFLDHGPRHLRPLTQTSVARELGIHPSTVSRATAGKFAQLPSQDLLPLHRFFAGETRAQDLVRQMIAQENVPLSDEQIARRLRAEQGISVSRQMIANYRVELKIPAARQRGLLRRRKESVV